VFSLSSCCCRESSSPTTFSFDTEDKEDRTERIAYISLGLSKSIPALSCAKTAGNPPVVMVDAKQE